MSQAPAPTRSAPRNAGAPTSVPGSRSRGPVTTFRGSFEGTPGRMRLVAAATALAAALFGVLAATTLWSSSAAVGSADHNTTQVIRVQSIYSDLLRADADATNTFLVGGLEDPSKREDYDTAIATVAAKITEAAQAQPADGEALGILNQQVQAYTSLVEQARAYNRQGLPLGAAYLTLASTGLRSGAMPVVSALTSANQQRTQDEIKGSGNSLWLVLAGTVAVVVLLLALVWVARLSHRYLNLALGAGMVLVLVALITGAAVLSSVRTTTDEASAGPVKVALDLATISTVAFDAKADESLTLVARGNGASYEQSWKQDSAVVTAAIADLGTAASGLVDTPAGTSSLSAQWTAYTTLHQKIRALDDGSQYDQAVAMASSVSGTSTNAAFAAFSGNAAQALQAAEITASGSLTAPRTSTTVWGGVLLVVCLAAAGLVVRGFARRLEEYR